MTTSRPPTDRVPVIVGIGEITDRPKEIADGIEPLALLVEALKRAETDSGAAWRNRIARYRQFPELALPRPRKTARGASRHSPQACLLRAGRRRKPDPLSARSRPTHRTGRMRRGGHLRRRSAEQRDAGDARRCDIAVDAVRA